MLLECCQGMNPELVIFLLTCCVYIFNCIASSQTRNVALGSQTSEVTSTADTVSFYRFNKALENKLAAGFQLANSAKYIFLSLAFKIPW